MTERLYYREPRLGDFQAVVRTVTSHDDRWLTVLDRTAFYPTSGGQPFDTGRLEDFPVVEVTELADGSIGHVVEGELRAGQAVKGVIDWPRRFDHMQQHTGQHVLSAAFERCHKVPTVSFHLGVESSTIDLQREIPPDAIAEAVAEANRIVWQNRAVAIRFATREEAATLPLRKEPGRDGLLRLIEVEGFDLSACGGTHVDRTGAVGIIAITGWERYKGGLRVHFVAGSRALSSFDAWREIVTGSARLLSVNPTELPAAIERLQIESHDLRKSVKQLHQELGRYEADAMAARGRQIGNVIVVAEVLEGSDGARLKSLAARIAGRPSHLAVLVASGPPPLVAIARSTDVPVDAAALLRELIAAFGGRGGGSTEMAQAGGLQSAPQEILARAEDAAAKLVG